MSRRTGNVALEQSEQLADEPGADMQNHAERRFVVGGAGEDTVGAGCGCSQGHDDDGGSDGDDAHDVLLE